MFKKVLLLIAPFLFIPVVVVIYSFLVTIFGEAEYIVSAVFIIVSLASIVLGYIFARKNITLFKHRMFYIIGIAFCNSFLIYYTLMGKILLFV